MPHSASPKLGHLKAQSVAEKYVAATAAVDEVARP